MKKVIAILLLVVVLTLSFTACAPKAVNYVATYQRVSDNKETAEVDETDYEVLDTINSVFETFDQEKIMSWFTGGGIYFSMEMNTEGNIIAVLPEEITSSKTFIEMRIILDENPLKTKISMVSDEDGMKTEYYYNEGYVYEVEYDGKTPVVTSEKISDEDLDAYGATAWLELDSIADFIIGTLTVFDTTLTAEYIAQNPIEVLYAEENGQHKVRLIVNEEETLDLMTKSVYQNTTIVFDDENLYGINSISKSSMSSGEYGMAVDMETLFEVRQLRITFPSYVSELFPDVY